VRLELSSDEQQKENGNAEGVSLIEMLDALESGIVSLKAHDDGLSVELSQARRQNALRALTPEQELWGEARVRTVSIQTVATLSEVHWSFPGSTAAPTQPEELGRQMERAGLTAADFAEIFRMPLEGLQDWLTGSRPIPPWVVPVLRILELVSPMARRKLLNRPTPELQDSQSKRHPFSRVEDL
jgi:hypothetical protein